MPSTPIDKCTRNVIVDILTAFWIPNDGWDETVVNLWSKVSRKFPSLSLMDDRGLSSVLRNNPDIKMRDESQYLLLEPTKDNKILPLVTLHSSEAWVHFRIYTLLTVIDEEPEVNALSIRFETDEGVPQRNKHGLHDFCHAQLCREIDHRIRASTPEWLPDSQPSIPVDAEDQVSLVLCMLTSLYGGTYVRQKINASGIRNVNQHFDKIRAFRPPASDI